MTFTQNRIQEQNRIKTLFEEQFQKEKKNFEYELKNLSYEEIKLQLQL